MTYDNLTAAKPGDLIAPWFALDCNIKGLKANWYTYKVLSVDELGNALCRSYFFPNTDPLCTFTVPRYKYRIIKERSLTRAKLLEDRDFFKERYEETKAKLDYLDQIGADEYDETEYAVYHALTEMSSEAPIGEKTKVIAKLIKELKKT